MSDKRADLVLEGGGVLGIAHVGALTAFLDDGWEFARVAGASAGAIVGALLAAGMSREQVEEEMRAVDYARFRDRSILDRVPLAGPALSLLLEDGIFEGEELRSWLDGRLRSLGVQRWGDLRLTGAAAQGLEPDRRYKLVVMVADLTLGELIRLPWDYRARYGLDPDEQPVAEAVRASAAIPFFYEPVRLRAAGGRTSTLVDGGVLSNFPIDTFDRTDGRSPRCPTFGVKLLPPLPAERARLFPLLGLIRRGPIHLLQSLVTTMVVGRDQAHLAKPWVAARAVFVDTSGVDPFDFGLSEAKQELLFRRGRTAAEAFLEKWDWDDYRERFRGGVPVEARG